MIDTTEAEDAWWPPTLTPDGVRLTLLAWWMIDVASHSNARLDRAQEAEIGALGDRHRQSVFDWISHVQW